MNQNIFGFTQKWANMITSTIVWTGIREYKYKYEYYNNTQYFFYMFMDIEAIQVCKLMHICATIYTVWYLNQNNEKIQNL